MSIRVALNHKTNYRFSRELAFAACHPAAPGAACPHAGAQLFAARRPRGSFHQLAAGSLQQSAGPAGLSEEDDANFPIEVDLIAEMTVINPFDFFLEKDAEEFPFKYDAVLAGN